MTIHFEEIVRACQTIAEQDHLDVCITESLKGASVAGISAFALGVLLGPIGIALGGTLGGIAGTSMCKSYKPLWQVLSDMSEQDKIKLANHMTRVITSLDVTDAVLLMAIVSNPTHAARDTIAKELCTYFGAAITST